MSRSFVGKVVVLSLIICLYFTPIISSYLGGEVQRNTFLIFVTFLIFYLLFFPRIKTTKFDKIPLYIAISSVLLFVISAYFWHGYHNVYSYLGIPIAFIAYLIDFRFTVKLLVFVLVISMLVAFYEYVSFEYLFSTTVQRGGEEVSLDMKLFSGNSDLTRAKGLFYGPLSLAHFAFGIALLLSRNVKIIVVGLLIAYLSSVRLSLVSISLIMLSFLFLSNKTSLTRRFQIVSVIALTSLFVLSYGSQYLYGSNVERILDTFDFSNPGNQARLMYFFTGLVTWVSYPITNMIFGNNTYYFSIYDNNPESGWITLLTDNGILGILFYLAPFVYCVYMYLKKKNMYELSLMIVLFMFLMVVTFHLSATSNFILWLVLFEKINLAKFNSNKYYECFAHR